MSRETMGWLLGFMGVVIFGGSLPFTRLAVADFTPWFVTMARAAAAGLIAAAVIVVLRRKVPAPSQWRDIVIASICLVIGFPALTAFAMQTVPASHGGVVLGILPLATASFSALYAGERPSLLYWLCAVAGAVLVVVFALRDSDMTLSIGDGYLFMAVIICGLGYVFSARLARQMPGWEVISWAVIIALPISIPVTLWLIPDNLAVVRPSAWFGLAYVSIMSQYLGFFAWNAGMAMGGVARVSQIQLLQTFVTLLISAFLLGEKVDAETFLFATAVVGIVLLGKTTSVKRA
ncbi:MAG: DMT family transporter [Beijerinckiaceae bacterium]